MQTGNKIILLGTSVERFVRCNQTVLLIFLAGLLLRLAIMPYFCHVDLFSEYRRVYKTIELGNYFPDLKRLVVYYIELFSLKLSLPFISDAAAMFHFTNLANSTAGLESFFLFVNHDHIYRILFLFKLPYLLFDMGTLYCVCRLMKGHSNRIAAVAVWWLNPITIYAFYVFGRYESIPLFFILLTLLSLSRQSILFASVAFGLAINSREINIIYLPLFILSLLYPMAEERIGKHLVKAFLPAVFILFCFYAFPAVLHRLIDTGPVFGHLDATGTNPAQRMFSMQYHWFVPFFFVYTLIAYWLLVSSENAPEKFFYAGSLCILSFLIFIEHSAHYVSWLVVFIAAGFYFSNKILFPFVCFCFSWFFLWLFMTDAGVFTLFLATPLSPNFFGVKTIPRLYTENAGSGATLGLSSVVWILRNIYAALLAIMGYTLVCSLRENKNV